MERSAIVLAGGFSSRFGQDKAVLEFRRKPLIQHVVDAISSVVEETLIVTSSKDRAEKYGKLLGAKAKFVIDIDDGKGPLIGALTGFKSAQGKYSLLLAADMPFVSREVVELLFELCHTRSAVIPRWPNQQIEPLQAVYRTSVALKAAEIAVEEGYSNVRSMIDNMGSVRYLSTLVVQQMDPELKTFFNVNTPLDLKRAELLVGEKPTKQPRKKKPIKF